MGAEWRIGNRTSLAVALGFLALAIFVALAMGASAQATYKGSERCSECHEDQYEGWQSTFHGKDFTQFMYGTPPHPINKYTYSGGNDTTGMTGSCAPCHVVGYKQLDKGGFDATKPWNDTYNLPLLGIGCENCHGPSSEHPKTTKKLDTGENAIYNSCAGTEFAQCHSGNRQYGNDTVLGFEDSRHFAEAPASAQTRISCAKCRSTEGFIAELEGTPLTAIPEEGLTWRIGCMACHDPHPGEGQEHDYQLRADREVICEKCHYTTRTLGTEEVNHPQTDMRKATKGYGVEKQTWMDEVSCPDCHMYQSPRGAKVKVVSHTWIQHPEACMVCHSEWKTAGDVSDFINETQEHIEELQTEANAYATSIKALKAWAMGNQSAPKQLWTDALNTTYYEALWDISMVEADKSVGMHNPDYAEDLLEVGMQKAGAIQDALNVGGVSGKVEWSGTPTTPIANASIKDGTGKVVATTGADGSYFFWAPAKAMLYVIESGGKPLGTMSVSGTSQQNKTVGSMVIEKEAPPPVTEDDEEPMLNTLSYVLIAVVVVLIILLVVMSMRKKPAAS